jgi:hypothetical protein
MFYFSENLDKLIGTYPFPQMILNAQLQPEIYPIPPITMLPKEYEKTYPKLSITKALNAPYQILYDQIRLELTTIAEQFYVFNMKVIVISTHLYTTKQDFIAEYLMAAYENELELFKKNTDKTMDARVQDFLKLQKFLKNEQPVDIK